MFKILSDIKYDGVIIPAGGKSDLEKLKKPELEKLMDNKIIVPVISQKAEVEAKAKKGVS